MLLLPTLTPLPPGKTCHLSAIFSPFPAPPVFLVRRGQQLIRARDMFLAALVYRRGLQQLDAVLVIEIEDELGEEKCGLRGAGEEVSGS